ncbi:MAG TPA: TetR/AcrR family transcriptional regulator [Nocardioides sp.]|nr:TetR/AcrR family transcriptional regulator [Nocardioides sp.]
MPHSETTVHRPRVEGDREQQILDATLEVLSDVGYDRLTMDAVATRAKASKATLYRRWNGKVSLVIDALLSVKSTPAAPDTGSLRGDLIESFCGEGGLTDERSVATFASVITAISRDREFAEAFRKDVIGPKAALTRTIFDRARERGEIPDLVDLDLLAPALAGIVLHRLYLMGEQPDRALITRVIDQIILPAATAPTAAAPSPAGTESPSHDKTKDHHG